MYYNRKNSNEEMLKNSMNFAPLLLLQLLLIAIAVQYSTADESFDVRQHLSTVSRSSHCFSLFNL